MKKKGFIAIAAVLVILISTIAVQAGSDVGEISESSNPGEMRLGGYQEVNYTTTQVETDADDKFYVQLNAMEDLYPTPLANEWKYYSYAVDCQVVNANNQPRSDYIVVGKSKDVFGGTSAKETTSQWYKYKLKMMNHNSLSCIYTRVTGYWNP